jgi:hypothetical protein
MTKWTLCWALLLLAAPAICGWSAEEAERLPEGQPTPRPEGEGWIDLFSGENVAGWRNVTDDEADIFSIEDGVFHIAGQKPTRYIAFMPRTFGDFELHIEFKLTENANSGVFFRSDPADPVQAGMEVQVLDGAGTQPTRGNCGALYDVASPMFNMVRPTGEWNSFDIRCVGPDLQVFCNGWMVLHVDLSKLTMPVGKFDTPLAELPHNGHIILQDHGGEVWFRNLVVRPLN